MQRNGEAWGETFKNLLSRTREIINPICFSVLNSVRKYRGRENRPSERELVSLEATEPWPGTARTVRLGTRVNSSPQWTRRFGTTSLLEGASLSAGSAKNLKELHPTTGI